MGRKAEAQGNELTSSGCLSSWGMGFSWSAPSILHPSSPFTMLPPFERISTALLFSHFPFPPHSLPPSLFRSLFVKKFSGREVRPVTTSSFLRIQVLAGIWGRATCQSLMGDGPRSPAHSQRSPGLSERPEVKAGHAALIPQLPALPCMLGLRFLILRAQPSWRTHPWLDPSARGYPVFLCPGNLASVQSKGQRGWNPSAFWDWILVMGRNTELRVLVSTMWCEWETAILWGHIPPGNAWRMVLL